MPPKQCLSNTLDIDMIFDKIAKINQFLKSENKPKKKKNILNMLIIFDDVSSELDEKKNDKRLKQLFQNRRHLINNNLPNEDKDFRSGTISIITTA